jgi:hypothetical protein
MFRRSLSKRKATYRREEWAEVTDLLDPNVTVLRFVITTICCTLRLGPLQNKKHKTYVHTHWQNIRS